MRQRTHGFTIVEILIITVVIGILAAITVLAYGGIQQQARESGVKSDFETTAARLERYRSDMGEYPPVNSSDVNLLAANIEIQKSLYATDSNNYLYCVSADGQTFILVAKATNNLTYAYGTNQEFGRYTAFNLSDYTQICDTAAGAPSGKRYAFVGSTGWRTWSQ